MQETLQNKPDKADLTLKFASVQVCFEKPVHVKYSYK